MSTVSVVRSSTLDTRIRFTFSDDNHGVSDFKAEAGELTVRYSGPKTVVYAGLGTRADYAPHVLRSAAAAAAQRVAALKRLKVALELGSTLDGHSAALEGVVLGTYAFDKYLSEKAHRFSRVELETANLSAADARRVQAVCDGVCYARDLVNDNAALVTPEFLAAQAREIGRAGGMKVDVLDERQLRAKGLNLLAAVGQGSPTPPRLVLVHYRGNPRSRDVTAVVGKGITFDSGGLNIKPSGHIETMRLDMAGAATVLGLMKALAGSGAKVNVTGVCAAAHNAIDGASYMPGDIIKSYAGKTVEICNTDAEGRLALADAIAYTRDTVKPARVIDLATLTGGILITFADVLCGLFSNDDALAGSLAASGEATRERMWRLPVTPEFSKAMKGDRSDLRSLATFKRGYASSITGAAFIKEFAGTTPWAHLDIAGVAYNEGEARGEIPKHGTGFGVRLLMHFLAHGV